MTRPGHSPIGEHIERKAARLMQLHVETHPQRIGQRIGISAGYVRRLWSKYEPREMAPMEDALAALKQGRTDQQTTEEC